MITRRKVISTKTISYSVGEYILRISAITIFSLICFIIFGNNSDALSSFIWSTIAFLFITIFSTVILLKSQRWVLFFVLAYFIKIILGLLHYLYFIDSEYFQSGFYKPITWEYEAVFDQILMSAHDKIQYGILYYQYFEGGTPHQEIISLISMPFIYFGDNVLTISPINSFSSLLISINIILISKYKFHFSNDALKYVAYVTAYFPMTLISTLLYRDIVGLTLMSIGVMLILFSKKIITQYLLLILACYLFYLHRTIYPFLLLLAFVMNSIINQNYKSKRLDFFYKFGIISLSIILLPIIINYANTESNESMAGGSLNFNILILPLKLILGLIGPFPWTQFFLYNAIPANAYQLQDYLQGTFNIAFVATIIIFRKKFLRKREFNLLNILGILIILSGLFNSYMHMTYVAIGFIFLSPWLFTHVNLSEFSKIYLYSFLLLIFLNIIIEVFLGSIGISSLWK